MLLLLFTFIFVTDYPISLEQRHVDFIVHCLEKCVTKLIFTL